MERMEKLRRRRKEESSCMTSEPGVSLTKRKLQSSYSEVETDDNMNKLGKHELPL